MKFTDKLKSMHACPEAVKWVGKRGLKTAWRDCPRGGWMLWLAGRLDIDRKLLVLAACDCAETALKHVPEGENRPAIAIQAARNWCNGTATIDGVRAAAAAADAAAAAADDAAADAAAADDAADAAAADDAADAADAAYAAACAAYAAYADACAAYAAAAAAAKTNAHKVCADLVRARISYEIMKEALRGEKGQVQNDGT